jgi:hypothetical protein
VNCDGMGRTDSEPDLPAPRAPYPVAPFARLYGVSYDTYTGRGDELRELDAVLEAHSEDAAEA